MSSAFAVSYGLCKSHPYVGQVWVDKDGDKAYIQYVKYPFLWRFLPMRMPHGLAVEGGIPFGYRIVAREYYSGCYIAARTVCGLPALCYYRLRACYQWFKRWVWLVGLLDTSGGDIISWRHFTPHLLRVRQKRAKC